MTSDETCKASQLLITAKSNNMKVTSILLLVGIGLAALTSGQRQPSCDSYDMAAKEDPLVFLTVNSRDRKVELNWVEPKVVDVGDWVGLFKSRPNQTASKRDSGKS